MNKLVLSSNSARRQQLMMDAGYEFEIRVRDIDESFDDSIDVTQVAEYLAVKKNMANGTDADEVVVTSDTVVIVGNKILGKPETESDAFEMIHSMCGKSHLVISGVCISGRDKTISFSDKVEVELGHLSHKEIWFYIENYRPFDKAGAYGIQEWLGMVGISQIKGSFYSVMGLPMHKVYSSLRDDFGILPFNGQMAQKF